MSLKKIAAAAMAAIMTAALCGCDFNDLGSDGMLRPPKTMGDEAEIEHTEDNVNKLITRRKRCRCAIMQ